MTTVNDIKEIHKGRTFTLYTENVTLDNGVTADIDVIRHPGASVILPLINDTIVMIYQYRHAVGKYIYEIPAGTLNKGESPLECAKRELMEETGYTASHFEKMGEIIPVPGYSDELLHLFLAQNLSVKERNLDKDEVLSVKEFKVDKVFEMVAKGEIVDAKTLVALYFFRSAREH